MLKIRFQRKGRRKLPFYRIVVAEHSSPVKGKFVEIVGHFNPKTKETSLKEERINYWISVGAKPTDRVARLATKKGVTECEKFIKARVTKPTKAEKEVIEKAKQEAEEKAKLAKEMKENEKKEAKA